MYSDVYDGCYLTYIFVQISFLPNLFFFFPHVSAKDLSMAGSVYLTQRVVLSGVLRKQEYEISRSPWNRRKKSMESRQPR